MRVRMVSKMFIKGKNSFDTKLIYQDKAGAVSKTQPFVVKLFKNVFSLFLSIFINAKYSDVTLFHLIHEFDCCSMAASGFKKCINLVQNIIRCVYEIVVFLNLLVNSFCCGIMLVFRNGEGTESARINKNPQLSVAPYRYLSW